MTESEKQGGDSIGRRAEPLVNRADGGFDAELDEMLRAGLLQPPAEFLGRVMSQVAAAPLPAAGRRQPRRLRTVLEWLALGGAVIAGMAQLLPLLFGFWTFSNAG